MLKARVTCRSEQRPQRAKEKQISAERDRREPEKQKRDETLNRAKQRKCGLRIRQRRGRENGEKRRFDCGGSEWETDWIEVLFNFRLRFFVFLCTEHSSLPRLTPFFGDKPPELFQQLHSSKKDKKAEEEDGHERRERAFDPFTGIHRQPQGDRVRGSSAAEEEFQTVQFMPEIQIFIFISFTGFKICDIKQRGARRRRKRGASAIQKRRGSGMNEVLAAAQITAVTVVE
ncbi:hypothetical protein PIB30_007466 [Stylosanthes scabra]|uniref:Uncharacterized protein n=1 Tax=Stylosanthes scabra TaxID=79078 RepID=A0ABU6S421_9FABA|nr:hypothetical protein [Stylosanthes scabra]